MEMPKQKASEKFERQIDIAALKKSKIHPQHEYGGLSIQAVRMRYEGLAVRLVLDNLDNYEFKLNYRNVASLISTVMTKTERLKKSYSEIGSLEDYLEKPLTLHDVRRAIAALDYQQDRLKEVLKYLRAGEGKGKTPVQTLNEMSPEVFRKETASDKWQAGGRMATKNPLDAISVVIRPSEVRIVRKFLETLVENIQTLDNRIAEAMPVIDYGLAVFERNLKSGKIAAIETAPKPAPTPAPKPAPKPAAAPVASSAQVTQITPSEKLSDVSLRNLERNTHHIRGYLKSLGDIYTPEELAERRELLHEDIFQIIKARVATSASQHALSEFELREVFRQSILKGLEDFEFKSSGQGAQNIRALVKRAESEELTVVAKPEPKLRVGEKRGVLEAYAKAMGT